MGTNLFAVAAPTEEKFAAIARNEDLIEAAFVAPITIPAWQFNAQSIQPPRYPRKWQRYAATKGKSEFGITSLSLPVGWEQVFAQPPHPRREKSGAVAPISFIEGVTSITLTTLGKSNRGSRRLDLQGGGMVPLPKVMKASRQLNERFTITAGPCSRGSRRILDQNAQALSRRGRLLKEGLFGRLMMRGRYSRGNRRTSPPSAAWELLRKVTRGTKPRK